VEVEDTTLVPSVAIGVELEYCAGKAVALKDGGESESSRSGSDDRDLWGSHGDLLSRDFNFLNKE